MVNGKKVIGTPKLTLTKEQMDALNDFADEIEKIDLKPIPKKRLWRGHHYMGGANGVISDLELKRLNLPSEIEKMQRFMNLLVDIKFLSVQQLNVSGTYSRATFESVKSLQTELNRFLAEKKKGVYVPPSQEEKKAVAAAVAKIAKSEESLKGNIFNAPEGKEFETRIGKFTYKVRMGTKSKDGNNRVGFAEVFDEDGNRLKKIAFTVDKKTGKIYAEGTMLYRILVDGYIGIETLRAMVAYLKEKTTIEKELPLPKPIHLSMKVGYSFIPELIANWPYEKEALIIIMGNKTLQKNSKLIDTINMVLWNMPYDAEKSIRENPPFVEIDGKRYSATWQGLRQAYMDGVDVDKFLKEWINVLKKNPLTKDLVEKAEKGKLKKPDTPVNFFITGEMKGTFEGGNIGVDLSDISGLFGQAKRNIEQNFSDNAFRKEMISEVNRLQAMVENEAMNVLHKVEKEKGESSIKDRFIEELNNNRVLRNSIYLMYNYFGELPGSLSYIRLDVTYTGINTKEEMRLRLKEFIDIQLAKNKNLVEKTFKDAGIYNENPIRMAEKFMDKYCVYEGGRVLINLDKIESKDMRSFALLFRWELYKTQINAVEKKQEEKKAVAQTN
ncbi:MAG: hypothetical protein QW500_04225 [Candidatus Micrarchaeia archaeon]